MPPAPGDLHALGLWQIEPREQRLVGLADVLRLRISVDGQHLGRLAHRSPVQAITLPSSERLSAAVGAAIEIRRDSPLGQRYTEIVVMPR